MLTGRWDGNLHYVRELPSQYPEKINLWTGIFGKHIVDPFFPKLTGEGYLHLLEEHVIHRITNILDNDDELHENIMTFQQDLHPISIDMFGLIWIEIIRDESVDVEPMKGLLGLPI